MLSLNWRVAAGIQIRCTGSVDCECELYYAELDALFSRHESAAAFLDRVFTSFFSSHEKNSSGDLQSFSDAPARMLFPLLTSVRFDGDELSDVMHH